MQPLFAALAPAAHGYERVGLDLFSVGLAVAFIVAWMVAANVRMRRDA